MTQETEPRFTERELRAWDRAPVTEIQGDGKTELPALPEPIEYVVDPVYMDIVGDDDGEPIRSIFTADQMRAYAAAAVMAERERWETAEPVEWQFRWTNPANDKAPGSAMDWGTVRCAWNQTLDQRITELRAYRYKGMPCYEVRALYASPPAKEPT